MEKAQKRGKKKDTFFNFALFPLSLHHLKQWYWHSCGGNKILTIVYFVSIELESQDGNAQPFKVEILSISKYFRAQDKISRPNTA